jgi:flavodoxin
MSPRILVVFYSMTGTTRALANEIRDAAFGHLEEILEPRTRTGLFGVVRALFDGLTRREPTIEPSQRDPALYDLVLLGGPVWAGRMAAPVRTYARRYGSRASRIAFFCTQGGGDAAPAFADIAALCAREPVAVLAVPAASVAAEMHEAEVRDFVARALPPVVAKAPAAEVAQTRFRTA